MEVFFIIDEAKTKGSIFIWKLFVERYAVAIKNCWKKIIRKYILNTSLKLSGQRYS